MVAVSGDLPHDSLPLGARRLRGHVANTGRLFNSQSLQHQHRQLRLDWRQPEQIHQDRRQDACTGGVRTQQNYEQLVEACFRRRQHQ